LDSGQIKFKQIEACRRTIKRGLKKNGYLYIRVFTGLPITKKPIATRMGKGKGILLIEFLLSKKVRLFLNRWYFF
jgi:large subunit ribosomal protein L16